MAAGQPVGADVTVTNTGKVQGDEAVQVYLKFPAMKGASPIACRSRSSEMSDLLAHETEEGRYPYGIAIVPVYFFSEY